MSDEIQAWQVQLAPSISAIISKQSLGHIVDDFSLDSVPLTPDYASQVYCWRGQLIPVIDLSPRLQSTVVAAPLLGIVAYRQQQQIEIGALALYAPPALCSVPEDACDWPESTGLDWSNLSDCCVELNGQRLPIVNLDQLFTQPL